MLACFLSLPSAGRRLAVTAAETPAPSAGTSLSESLSSLTESAARLGLSM